MSDNVTLDQVRNDNAYNLVSLHEDMNDIDSFDYPFQYASDRCDYYEPEQSHELTKQFHESQTYFHLNCRGLSSNWTSFHELICDMHGDAFSFELIEISERFSI